MALTAVRQAVRVGSCRQEIAANGLLGGRGQSPVSLGLYYSVSDLLQEQESESGTIRMCQPAQLEAALPFSQMLPKEFPDSCFGWTFSRAEVMTLRISLRFLSKA